MGHPTFSRLYREYFCGRKVTCHTSWKMIYMSFKRTTWWGRGDRGGVEGILKINFLYSTYLKFVTNSIWLRFVLWVCIIRCKVMSGLFESPVLNGFSWILASFMLPRMTSYTGLAMHNASTWLSKNGESRMRDVPSSIPGQAPINCHHFLIYLVKYNPNCASIAE